MSEYSGSSLVKMLGIKPDTKILLAGIDSAVYRLFFESTLPNVINEPMNPSEINFIHFFLHDTNNLKDIISLAKENLVKNGQLWISWPKKTSKLYVDLDESIIREAGLDVGLVDVKVCSISPDWSGLKFVYRLKDRQK